MAARKPKRLKLPATWTPAKIRVDKSGRVQLKLNPAALGSGGRFAKCAVKVVKLK
jgi:hypothetical protein